MAAISELAANVVLAAHAESLENVLATQVQVTVPSVTVVTLAVGLDVNGLLAPETPLVVTDQILVCPPNCVSTRTCALPTSRASGRPRKTFAALPNTNVK